MAQVISPWQQFLQTLENWLLPASQFKLFHRSIPSPLQRSRTWMFGAGSLVVLFLWDWKLVVSLGSGTTVLALVYAMQQWNWGGFQVVVRRLIASPNRSLAVAVVSGVLAILGTYMGIAIWIDTNNPWMAAGSLGQGIVTLVILAVLLGQNLSRFLNPIEQDIYDQLPHLTDADPLKRLIAVRQILRCVHQGRLETDECQAVSEAFRLMLQSETESIVLEAILKGLQELEEPKTLVSGTPPISLSQHSSSLPERQPISPSLVKQAIRVSSRF